MHSRRKPNSKMTLCHETQPSTSKSLPEKESFKRITNPSDIINSKGIMNVVSLDNTSDMNFALAKPGPSGSHKEKADIPNLSLDSSSDSDEQEVAKMKEFFKHDRLPYSSKEDEEIVKFLLRGDNIKRTSSVVVWRELQAIKCNPKRTDQSLKNRFYRNIKPYLLTRFSYLLNPSSIKKCISKFPELRNYKENENIPRKEPIVCKIMKEEIVKDSAKTENSEKPGRTEVNLDVPNKGDEGKSTETRGRGFRTETPVNWNLSINEILENTPQQIFKYSKSFTMISKNADIKCKIHLTHKDEEADCIISPSLLSGREKKFNVNVAITVTVSSEEDTSGGQKQHKKVESCRISPRKKKSCGICKRKNKKTLMRNNHYCLMLRKRESIRYPRSYEKSLNSIVGKLQNIAQAKKTLQKPQSSEEQSDNLTNMDFENTIDCTSGTILSTEDESCWSEVLEKVTDRHQLVLE